MWKKALTDSPDGIYIDIEVAPGSSSQAIRGYDEWRNRIKVAVKAEARDGRANTELVNFLGKLFGVPPRRIRIISGLTTGQKRVIIEGLEMKNVIEKLGAHLGPA